MRALTVVASAAATGLAAGAASRFAAAPSPSARATLALLVVFGLAACMAAAAARSDADLRARGARAGVVAVAAFGAAWIATAVAGEPGVMGACIAVTGAAVLAHGVAALLPIDSDRSAHHLREALRALAGHPDPS